MYMFHNYKNKTHIQSKLTVTVSIVYNEVYGIVNRNAYFSFLFFVHDSNTLLNVNVVHPVNLHKHAEPYVIQKRDTM